MVLCLVTSTSESQVLLWVTTRDYDRSKMSLVMPTRLKFFVTVLHSAAVHFKGDPVVSVPISRLAELGDLFVASKRSNSHDIQTACPSHLMRTPVKISIVFEI